MRNLHGATNDIASHLRSAVLISSLLVLPLVILEFFRNSITRQNAPGLIVLFGLLWLLPMMFMLILLPTVRARQSMMANPFSLLFRVALLALIAFIWGGIMIDQLPCFMGVPNCD